MQNITFTVDSKILKALLITAAKQDIRYYLKSICFEFGSFGIKGITTDGHRMSIAHISKDSIDNNFEFIIDRQFIELALKTKNKFISFSIQDDEVTIADSITCKKMDWKYPDHRRVIPKKCEEKIAHFNNDYLADIDKQSNLLGFKFSPALFQNGKDIAFCVLRDDFVSYVMPMRKDEPSYYMPNFCLA